MASHVLQTIGARLGAGRGLWAFVAFLFPTLAVVRDDSVALAMLLFVAETLLASALLGVRVAASRRAHGSDVTAAYRLHEAWRVLLIFVGPFSLACAFMLGAVTAIEASKGGIHVDLAAFLDRGKWMALLLVASVAIDTLVAPVRSVHWLETSVAWQGSRTAVMFLAVLVGWPFMLFTGTTQAFFWIFFALRLLTDIGSLQPGERERIRTQMFGEPYAPPATVEAAGQRPPTAAA